MKKCEAYHTRERTIYSPYFESRGLVVKEGECQGTPEKDICYCKGDKCQCDVYPEVRAKAREEKYIEDKRKGNECAADILKFCLTSRERDGMVYIPKRILEKIIEVLG